MVESWLDSAADWPLLLVIGVAVLMAFGETALFTDFVVPGEVAMVFLGAAVVENDRGPGAVAAVAVAGGLGALAGDLTSHLLGRTVGQGILERSGWLHRRVSEPVTRARRLFERRGGAAIIVARLVGPIRAAGPFVAGLSGWPARRLAPWSAVSSLVWPAYVVVLGAVAGRPAARGIDTAGRWVLGAAVLGVGALWVRRRRRRRFPVSAAPAGGTPGGDPADDPR